MKIIFITFTILTLLCFISCRQKNTLTPKEGYVNVDGGKVWYRVVGEGEGTPLILVHGGPGTPSYSLDPLAPLGNERSVIFFDQLGCGRSYREIDTTFMTIGHHVDQLRKLVIALNLEDYYLQGHSYGTIVATEYYSMYPEDIRGLILGSPIHSTELWTRDADYLISTLPDSVQADINHALNSGDYVSDDYQRAMMSYYTNFVGKKLPWSADLDSSFSEMSVPMYNYMWGPSEFTAKGTLLDYNGIELLKEIKISTLFTTGEFDEAREETVRYYQSLVPNAQFQMIPDAGHVTMHDNPEANIRVIREFLRSLD